jgi:hypothetical protein
MVFIVAIPSRQSDPDAEKAFQVSASQQCGKILLYPHRH